MNSWQEEYNKSVREEAGRIERAEADRTESEKFVDRISLAPDPFLPVAAVVAGFSLLFLEQPSDLRVEMYLRLRKQLCIAVGAR